MDKRLTYGEIISSPQFWADITRQIIVATSTLAATMVMKELMTRIMFGAPKGNVIPFRNRGV